MMTKSRLAVFVLIFMSLIIMLALAGCASETPVTELRHRPRMLRHRQRKKQNRSR